MKTRTPPPLRPSSFRTLNFDPNQPRDEEGRWSGDGSGPLPNPQAAFPHLKHLLVGTSSLHAQGLTKKAAVAKAKELRSRGVFAGTLKDPQTGKYLVFNAVDPTTNFDPDQPRDEDGQWTSAGGGGGRTHSVKLPKNRTKLSIGTAAKALAQMGHSLRPAGFDLATKTALYDLTRPDGSTARVTVDEIKETVYRGAKTQARNDKRQPVPARRLDPTRTGTVRRVFARQLRARFKRLKGAIYKLLVTDDAFGMQHRINLTKTAPVANAPGDYAFETSPEQLRKFERWIRSQVKTQLTGKTQEELWQKYLADAFKRGAGRAFDDARKRELSAAEPGSREDDMLKGGKQEFLRSAFGRPETKEKVELIAGRTFSDMAGVTEQMVTRMGRTLADGLARGANPREVARQLDDDLEFGQARAELVARTEFIRAHAEGQLDAFDALGVAEIGVEVEWSTAGDERVCPECEGMEGKTFTIEDAHGLIPAHPNCRCSFIPANVGERDVGARRGAVDE